jgi:DNA-binding FrmR family transcriptional regulator
MKKTLKNQKNNCCADRVSVSVALKNRLSRIEGQVRAISKMIDNMEPCENILQLINAAKSALHRTGQIVLENHLQYCVVDGIKNGRSEEIIKKLVSALDKFLRIN